MKRLLPLLMLPMLAHADDPFIIKTEYSEYSLHLQSVVWKSSENVADVTALWQRTDRSISERFKVTVSGCGKPVGTAIFYASPYSLAKEKSSTYDWMWGGNELPDKVAEAMCIAYALKRWPNPPSKKPTK